MVELNTFSETWPRSGSMLNGFLYERPMLAHPIAGSGSLSWPTPTTQEVPHPETELTESGRRKTKDGQSSHSLNLQDRASNWATPVAGDDERKVTVNSLQPGLVGDVDRFHGRPVQEALKIGGKLSKSDQTSLPRLNPRFVEWMMGWPEGWLELSSFVSSETE